MSILVTGGCGFIGSNFILQRASFSGNIIVNLDSLTYAGNPSNLCSLNNNSKYVFVHGSILDQQLLAALFEKYQFESVVNFAAETHVDRSISNPEVFISTNVMGTYRLLEASYVHWKKLNSEFQEKFRFIHVSTDEVYGALTPTCKPFNEQSQYQPNSPYSASKASSDHIARSYFKTYGLPVIVTNCSNNYGPYQFPEKLIPLVIENALTGVKLPIYGDGKQVRDWLYVGDHCHALEALLLKGNPGEVYCIGGENEMSNLKLVNKICSILDELKPLEQMQYCDLIHHVQDRAGHDFRYSIEIKKIREEVEWTPKESFESGLFKTVQWYLDNKIWRENIVKKTKKFKNQRFQNDFSAR